ncbi:unnamed protein product [Pseudo-nitzschia multistriata]|uniref:SRR1-like domain-containing protein n=1 Tax=Pseudo-nitzschia multistriata TaxID=183589 RepID=A0A448ZNJ0_9STRA|nr:unnamed protein product [Pseudo-nitzschia multistriata]
MSGDEWTTIQKPTRRRRPQRRRNHQHGTTVPSPALGSGKKDASAFFEKAVAATLRSSVDAGGDAVTPDQIEGALEACLGELRQSRYWETVREALDHPAGGTVGGPGFRSIVCYGIGAFGTKRPSGPTWQLALALLIREHAGRGKGPQPPLPKMSYYEPIMTPQESEVLERLGITVIEENERGRRSVNSGDQKGNNDGNDNSATLFFMPHCPLSLYTNLLHTNWDCLRLVAIFGNSLGNYINGGNTSIATDPQRKQALSILEVLQPFWEVKTLEMDKRDVADRSAYFEQAFNDSSLTYFSATNRSATADMPWPERPHLDAPSQDGGGEVL